MPFIDEFNDFFIKTMDNLKTFFVEYLQLLGFASNALDIQNIRIKDNRNILVFILFPNQGERKQRLTTVLCNISNLSLWLLIGKEKVSL